jgi:hypothetical protein
MGHGVIFNENYYHSRFVSVRASWPKLERRTQSCAASPIGQRIPRRAFLPVGSGLKPAVPATKKQAPA